MLILGLAVAIWLVIGFGFGLPRAVGKYREEIARYPTLYQESPRSVKIDAFIDASLTLLGCMLLGLFAAVAFVAWRLVEVYLTEEKTGKNGERWR